MAFRDDLGNFDTLAKLEPSLATLTRAQLQRAYAEVNTQSGSIGFDIGSVRTAVNNSAGSTTFPSLSTKQVAAIYAAWCINQSGT